MTNQYLQDILDRQAVRDESKEMKALRDARKEVEHIIQSEFSGCSPRYGGSKAKGTMNLLDYDLDIICYFSRDDQSAGQKISDIYYNMANIFGKNYNLELKTSAIKLLDSEKNYLHIDIVPGRFIEGTSGDAFLHQHDNPNKGLLKTNLDHHISYIRDSRCIDEIRLAKLWRSCVGIEVKTFPLELVVVKVLKSSGIQNLEDRFLHVLEKLRDDIHSISIEDPANHNNDLSNALSPYIKQTLSEAAADTFAMVLDNGWEMIFDKLTDYSRMGHEAALHSAIITNEHPTQPWSE